MDTDQFYADLYDKEEYNRFLSDASKDDLLYWKRFVTLMLLLSKVGMVLISDNGAKSFYDVIFDIDNKLEGKG